VNTPKRRVLAGALALTLVAAACGSDDDTSSDTDTPDATEAPESTDAESETTDAPDEGGEDEGGEEAGGDLSGSIFISGSSTVEPISIAAADVFADRNPGVAMTVEGPGTGDGFAKFCNGESDSSGASRAMKEEEIAVCEQNDIEFIELQVAVDGIAVLTSPENTAVECLSFVDLYALLGPDATGVNNWSDATAQADEIAATVTDLGAVNTPYPDAPLAITAPGEESGTFDFFVEEAIQAVGEALGVEDANVRPDYTASPNDNVIIEGIASNPTSLGWVGYAFASENADVVKAITIDGGDGCVEVNPDTIASGEYPISRPLFMYVSVPALESNPALEPYFDYVVGEAMTTVIGAEEGQVPYVQLNDELLAETERVWEAKETGTRQGG
jgi:phosphate transport system substrate-binding protein